MAELSINRAVGEALRDVRHTWRSTLILAAIGGALSTALGLAPLYLGQSTEVPLDLVQSFVAAGIYAALLGPPLQSPFSDRLPMNMARVWAALLIVGAFLVLAMLIVMVPTAILIGMRFEPYMPALTAAGDNSTAVLAVMTRFARDNPVLCGGIALLYAILWLMLTSRFYLAAPATVAEQRILSFETWRWTQNNMLRIAAARLMLLLPAYVLAGAITALVARLVGFNLSILFDSDALVRAARTNPAGLAAFSFVYDFLSIAVYRALEARLSASAYEALKPRSSRTADIFN